MVPPRDSSVFSIPPGAPFLSTLVEALLNGKLVDGFHPQRDPLKLADVTIWLPTRRAARALASEFVTRFDGEAALLPQIHALGDSLDDVEAFLSAENAPDILDNSAIDPMARHLTLTVLIEKWATTLNQQQRALFAGADVAVPSSTADAVRFAAELSRLMDTVATEEADWKKLDDLVPQDHADWWQLTLEFLKIATTAWPRHLAERGLQDGAMLQAARLRRRAAEYQKADAEGRLKGPVIAAGSTGSIPATAQLITTISRLSKGAVVLPGLDRDLDPETWAKIDLPDNDRNDSGTAPGQPQYGLKRLLDHLQTDRSIIHHIGGIDDSSTGFTRIRETLLSEALRPSFATGHWRESLEKLDDTQRTKALQGIALVEAPGERTEALAIALALRETLNDANATAALVTPDRNLARRVAVEMRRFGVPVDDSAGQPLLNRSVGSFARLVVECAFGDGGTVALASLIKHPLSLFGSTPARARRAASVLDMAVLRGVIVPPEPAGLPRQLAGKRAEIAAQQSRYLPASLKRLSDNDWRDAAWLADRIAEIFTGYKINEQLDVGALAARSIQIMEACATDDVNELAPLYDCEAGTELQAFLTDLLDHGSTLSCSQSQWPSVFAALLEGRIVRPIGGTHPRVTILGPIEARLQNYDRVVLGGLNENTWPATARNDPFLSRPMKLSLGLPTPERRTGLAAHDFQMLLGMKDVVLTRPAKADNAPTIASRWVQRLAMVAGEKSTEEMKSRGRRFLDWADQIDAPSVSPRACLRPNPKPPVELRPQSLSITEIEKWIRDPYEIYCRHILKLETLEPLTRQTGPLERGTLYHSIMEEFAGLSGADIQKGTLIGIARRQFDEFGLPEEIKAVWWPRFASIAAEIANWQLEQSQRARKFFIERYGKTSDGLDGFVLRGRADRIDVLDDGTLSLVDFKTGTLPSKSQVEALFAPQLPLEAAMARRGAFGEALQAEAAELAYVRLRPSGEFGLDVIGKSKGRKTASELGEDAWAQLLGLVRAYADIDRGYVSKLRPSLNDRYESEFDHLARVREWSVAEDSDSEAGDT